MTQEGQQLPITSSQEPDWASEARECYRDVVQVLQQAEVPCTVGGAFAMQKHTGIWRSTKDLDVLLVPTDVPRALAQLEKNGFETHVEDPVWLAKAHRGKYFVDLITGVGNASLLVDESWIDRSSIDYILETPCRILPPEELIASKCFVARRERFDGADIAHLVFICGKQLDWQRILQLLGVHWELLLWSLALFAYTYPAHTDLVPESLWGELIQRFTDHVLHPRKDEPSRGSLVDPKMFAIDVNEWGERNLYQEYYDRHPHLLSTPTSRSKE